MVQWSVKPFNELNLAQQNQIQKFLGVNGTNPLDRNAYHLWAIQSDQVVAYARIYRDENGLVFDRFRATMGIDPKDLLYRILEVGHRFFEDCRTVCVAMPFSDALLQVYADAGFAALNDKLLMMGLNH